MNDRFIPALQLAGEFYAEAVRPLLDEEFPALRYAAALLGPGSEVLGFDTERSTDHDWGPRLQVFLAEDDAGPRLGQQAEAITALLGWRLPAAFRGFQVAFPVTREPDGVPRHRVQVSGLGTWLSGQLGFDPRPGVRVRDWRDLMRLWLLMHRRYPPYSKWLGSAFARVPGTAALAASLTSALSATEWRSRERYLSQAYVVVAEAHNRLRLTEPLDPGTRGFYDRPYQVLEAGRFAAALAAAITDPLLRELPPVGAADQFMDSTDALGDLRWPRAVTSAF